MDGTMIGQANHTTRALSQPIGGLIHLAIFLGEYPITAQASV